MSEKPKLKLVEGEWIDLTSVEVVKTPRWPASRIDLQAGWTNSQKFAAARAWMKERGITAPRKWKSPLVSPINYASQRPMIVLQPRLTFGGLVIKAWQFVVGASDGY